jgi:hypothetical protein
VQGKLHLFSVYTDFGLCPRVKWIAGALAKLAGHRWRCTAEMWRLDSLIANEAMKKMLAADAATADVLMVVAASLAQRRPELTEWLASLPPPMPLHHGLLIGLLGDEDDHGQEVDWTTKQLIQFARNSNRKFVWHWIGHHDGDVSDWLGESVETLLTNKEPAGQPSLIRDSPAVWQAA